MSERKPVFLSWSGGKDSALALSALRRGTEFEVVGLLTSVTRGYDRISVHGVRRSLLHAQAESLGLPLQEILLDQNCTNESYEAAFHQALQTIRETRPEVAHIAFGDLFLEDVRAYRERLLKGTGFDPVFPIWGVDTAQLARSFISDGYRARLVCVDTTQLDESFAGREFDPSLLADLPATADPCGERGEFHTFVSSGPGFALPVSYQTGERVLREQRFMYCDLI
ncbi:MAG: ATP-binding protein [Gemmatimonadetes bacterium]|nr:MAG: ATP-binding protein [Gemmatimonadota bacterium]PYO76263.1 MAG: ATP-binding protein [Gemmatimonadota bacterium]